MTEMKNECKELSDSNGSRQTWCCIYDNPTTMARECYAHGKLTWSIKAATLASVTFTPESYWDRINWEAGAFHFGCKEALPFANQYTHTMKLINETYKELGIAFAFPIRIKDANGNLTYYEDFDGLWDKWEYDANDNETYRESSNGYWVRFEYDADGYVTYRESSSGYKNGTPRSNTNQ